VRPKPRPDTSIIQSLDKGLMLLETVEQAKAPVGLADLATRLGWDKATIHRLLATLERRGYLLRDPSTRRYALGLKIFGLYESATRSFDIQRETRPYLARIAEHTGETAHLAVALSGSIVFIDRVASSESLAVNTQIGAQEPLFCTALGRAILAYLPEEELRRHVPAPLPRYTRKTVSTIPALRASLDSVRSRGYAVDDEEYLQGIRCVASPILGPAGAPVAAIGISGPLTRLSMATLRRFGGEIRRAARELSERAGWRGAARRNAARRDAARRDAAPRAAARPYPAQRDTSGRS